MNAQRELFQAVAANAQSGKEIAREVRRTPNAADAMADVIAIEKDIAITRHFFDAMNEPYDAFHGFDSIDTPLDSFPTPAVLADAVDALSSDVIEQRPREIVVLLIDRLLVEDEPDVLRRHLGLISHPMFLIQTLYARAVMAIQSDQWETAVKELELMQTLAPYLREVLLLRGRYHGTLKDWLKAAEYYDAEMSTADELWTRRSVDAAAVIVAHEDYRGYTIRFHGGMYEAVDLGKQRVIDLDKTRAAVLVRIAINEVIFRIRRRFGRQNRNQTIRMPHLHEVMNAVDELLDKKR